MEKPPRVKSKLVGLSKKVRIAVAFWGDGAMRELGLADRADETVIICNLKSGGTNPEEIRKLIGKKLDVRQCDILHGKVYLFDDAVLLGSSNAAANGLAYQGAELSGWQEANALIDDPDICLAASNWFERLPHREITETILSPQKRSSARAARLCRFSATAEK